MNNFQAHVYPVSDSFKEKYFSPHLADFRGMYCLKPIRPLNFTIVLSGERFLPGFISIRRKDGSTMSSRGRTLKSVSGGNLSSAWLWGGLGWKESRGPPFNYLDPLRKDCVHEANVHNATTTCCPKGSRWSNRV